MSARTFSSTMVSTSLPAAGDFFAWKSFKSRASVTRSHPREVSKCHFCSDITTNTTDHEKCPTAPVIRFRFSNQQGCAVARLVLARWPDYVLSGEAWWFADLNVGGAIFQWHENMLDTSAAPARQPFLSIVRNSFALSCNTSGQH